MVLDKLITRHCFICNRRGDIVKKENLSEIKESKILEKMKVVFQNEIEKIKLIPQKPLNLYIDVQLFKV